MHCIQVYITKDDGTDMLEEQLPQLIHCDSYNGVMYEQMQLIRDTFVQNNNPFDLEKYFTNNLIKVY